MPDMIGTEIKITSNLIRRRMDALASDCCEGTCTSGQGMMIHYLVEHQDHEVYQRELEQAFNIRRATATKILNRMEQNGLILRRSVAKDRRLKQLVLTERALKQDRLITDAIQEMEQKLTEGISAEKLQVFCAVIRQMQNNISECEP